MIITFNPPYLDTKHTTEQQINELYNALISITSQLNLILSAIDRDNLSPELVNELDNLKARVKELEE